MNGYGLNNRYLATLIWFGVILVWIASRRDMRSSLRAVLGALLQWKLLVPMMTLAANAVTAAALAQRVGLWHRDLVADTALWFVAGALVMMFNIDHTGEEPHHFRSLMRTTVRATVLVEVLVNLVVFSLPIELVLQPALAFLAMLSAYAGTEMRFRQVKSLVDWSSAAFGFGVLIYVASSMVDHWGEVDKTRTLLQFAMPIWATVGVIPFLYVLSLLMNYESAFLRMRLWNQHRKTRWRIKAALLMTLHVRTHAVGALRGDWLVRLGRADSFDEARRVAIRYRASLNNSALSHGEVGTS